MESAAEMAASQRVADMGFDRAQVAHVQARPLPHPVWARGYVIRTVSVFPWVASRSITPAKLILV